MTRPWERPLPAPEALEGLAVPPPEPPPPARRNKLLVVFNASELADVEAVAGERAEPLAVTIRVLAVAAAVHLVDRGAWPSAPPEIERSRRHSSAREARSLVVFSDEEFAAIREAALNRWDEAPTATVRTLAVAAARHLRAEGRSRGQRKRRPRA